MKPEPTTQNQPMQTVTKINRANQITTYTEPTKWIEVTDDQLPESLRQACNQSKCFEYCQIIKENGSDNIIIIKEKVVNKIGLNDPCLSSSNHQHIFWKEAVEGSDSDVSTFEENVNENNSNHTFENNGDYDMRSEKQIQSDTPLTLPKDVAANCAMSQEFLESLQQIIDKGPSHKSDCQSLYTHKTINRRSNKADFLLTKYEAHNPNEYKTVIEAYPLSFQWFSKKFENSDDIEEKIRLKETSSENILINKISSDCILQNIDCKKPCPEKPPPCPPPPACKSKPVTDPNNVNIRCSSGNVNFKLSCTRVKTECGSPEPKYECEVVDEGKCVDSTILESCNLKCEEIIANLEEQKVIVEDLIQDPQQQFVEVEDVAGEKKAEAKVSTMECEKNGIKFTLKCKKIMPDPKKPDDMRFECELGEDAANRKINKDDVQDGKDFKCKTVAYEHNLEPPNEISHDLSDTSLKIFINLPARNTLQKVGNKTNVDDDDDDDENNQDEDLCAADINDDIKKEEEILQKEFNPYDYVEEKCVEEISCHVTPCPRKPDRSQCTLDNPEEKKCKHPLAAAVCSAKTLSPDCNAKDPSVLMTPPDCACAPPPPTQQHQLIYACRSKPKVDKCDNKKSFSVSDPCPMEPEIKPINDCEPDYFEDLKQKFMENHEQTMKVIKLATNDLICKFTKSQDEICKEKELEKYGCGKPQNLECLESVLKTCGTVVEQVVQGTKTLSKFTRETIDGWAGLGTDSDECDDGKPRKTSCDNNSSPGMELFESIADVYEKVSTQVRETAENIFQKEPESEFEKLKRSATSLIQNVSREIRERDSRENEKAQSDNTLQTLRRSINKTCDNIFETTSSAIEDVTTKTKQWFENDDPSKASKSIENIKKVISGVSIFNLKKEDEKEKYEKRVDVIEIEKKEEQEPERKSFLQQVVSSFSAGLAKLDMTEKSSIYDRPPKPRDVSCSVSEESIPVTSRFTSWKERLCSLFYNQEVADETMECSNSDDSDRFYDSDAYDDHEPRFFD